jgi:hypothetical protein
LIDCETSRALLNETWASVLLAADAASVKLVNEVDTEEVPVPASFTYIEADYLL